MGENKEQLIQFYKILDELLTEDIEEEKTINKYEKIKRFKHFGNKTRNKVQ